MIISQQHIDQMFALARQSYPEECCGLITGENDVAHDIHPSPNVSTGDRTQTFEVDPQLRFDLIRNSGSRQLLGLFHSHPGGRPYPSATDKAMVYEPELVWIILTLEEIKAFRFIEAKQDFAEIPIQVKL